jgi:hypothetical protein
VKLYVSQIILKGLKSETFPANTEMLLWLAIVNLFEVIDDTSDFAHLAIELILSKIKNSSWPPRVILVAFRVLSTMTKVYQKIPNRSDVNIITFLALMTLFRKQLQ